MHHDATTNTQEPGRLPAPTIPSTHCPPISFCSKQQTADTPPATSVHQTAGQLRTSPTQHGRQGTTSLAAGRASHDISAKRFMCRRPDAQQCRAVGPNASHAADMILIIYLSYAVLRQFRPPDADAHQSSSWHPSAPPPAR